MVAVILQYLIQFWFYISSTIVGKLLEPIFNFLYDRNIINENYLDTLQSLLNQLLDAVKFARDCFINITGVPVELFTILAGVLFLMFELYIGTLVLRFILNTLALIRFQKTSVKAVGGK